MQSRTWAEPSSDQHIWLSGQQPRAPVTREGLVWPDPPHVPSLLCMNSSIGLHNPHISHWLVTPFTTFLWILTMDLLGNNATLPSMDAFWVVSEDPISHSIDSRITFCIYRMFKINLKLFENHRINMKFCGFLFCFICSNGQLNFMMECPKGEQPQYCSRARSEVQASKQRELYISFNLTST